MINNNPCLLSPVERLQDWRKFRETLTEDDLIRIIDWWSLLPFTTRSIDIYNSKQWPNPWELVYYGDFCKSSISLGIAYTLCLMDDSFHIQTDWQDRVKLLLIDDSGLDIFLVVLLDDKYLINYNYREIIEFDSADVKVLETFSCDNSIRFIIKEKKNG